MTIYQLTEDPIWWESNQLVFTLQPVSSDYKVILIYKEQT